MGIKDLYKVLKEECPDEIQKCRLSELSGISIAIDISVFLYKFIRSCGPEYWKNSFILLLCTLKKHGIKAVCVFDGPNPPKEKSVEQDRRRAESQKTIHRLKECRALRDLLWDDLIPNNETITEQMKKDAKALISLKRGKVDTTNYNNAADIHQALNITIEKLTKQTLPITKDFAEKAKEIIEKLGMAQFQASGEAETLCAYLAIKGHVHAVLTEDTDVLAYGTPCMLAFKDFKINEEQVYILNHASILEELELNVEEFRDLCILLSCDYNDRVKGFPPDGVKRKKPIAIGAKKAFLMIKEYRRLEEVIKYVEDPSPLKFRRCRELFTIPSDITEIVVPENRPVNFNELKEYFSENRINIDISFIEKIWAKPQIIIESDSEEE